MDIDTGIGMGIEIEHRYIDDIDIGIRIEIYQ